MTPRMSESKRWTLHKGGNDWDEARNTDYIAGPSFDDGVEVMPASEHESLREAAQAVLEAHDEVRNMRPALGRLRELIYPLDGGPRMSVDSSDYEAAMDALVPFAEGGWIQGNPEDLELMAHAVLDRMSPEAVTAMLEEHKAAHREMLKAMGRDRP